MNSHPPSPQPETILDTSLAMKSAANRKPSIFEPNQFVFNRPPSKTPPVYKIEQPNAVDPFAGPPAPSMDPQKLSATLPTRPKSTLLDGPHECEQPQADEITAPPMAPQKPSAKPALFEGSRKCRPPASSVDPQKPPATVLPHPNSTLSNFFHKHELPKADGTSAGPPAPFMDPQKPSTTFPTHPKPSFFGDAHILELSRPTDGSAGASAPPIAPKNPSATRLKSDLFFGAAPTQALPLLPALTNPTGSIRVLLVEKRIDPTTSATSFLIRSKTGMLITDALRRQYVKRCFESLRGNPDVCGYLSQYMEAEMYQGWAVDDVIDTIEKDRVLVIIKKIY